MPHYFKNACYVLLYTLIAAIANLLVSEIPILGYLLYLFSGFMLVGVFFKGISDSVKDGAERARKDANKEK